MLQINGQDLTRLPLIERRRQLRDIIPTVQCRVLFLDGIAERGRDLFRVACERDLEGIVAKWGPGTYQLDGRSTSWLKIKNPAYTQIQDRHKLFELRPPLITSAHQRPAGLRSCFDSRQPAARSELSA